MGTGINPAMTFVGPTGVFGQDSAKFNPPMTSSKEVSVSMLDQRNNEYESRFEAWLDLSLLYEGGQALKARCERLLKKRPREDEEVYAARMDRFTYENILGTGLGFYGAAMFDVPPEILFNGGSGPLFYNKFLENCDGIGTSYIDFWKRAFQMFLTYGGAWILTDLKALKDGEEPPKTLKEEEDRGLRDPHVIAYSPLNVLNWKTDGYGELEWVVVKIEKEEQEFLHDREIVSTWFYYDRENYKVYEYRRKPEEQIRVASDDVGRTATLLREGKHALAHMRRVPIRRTSLTDGLWIANRAYLQLIDHLNQDNTLAWALFMSNLAIPVVIGDYDTSNMTYSEVGHLHFPSGTTYGWSEPEGHSFSHSASRVESLREECFRSMNLQAQGRSMHATPAMQSGRSKQLDMAPANKILAGMGDDLRRHMQDVLCDVRDARQEPNVHPDVRGFNFQEDMSTEQVFAVNSVLDMGVPSDSFERYLYMKVAKAWMTDASRESLTKVYDEIKNGKLRKEQQQDEMQKRSSMTRTNVEKALSARKNLPPGRGGDGPSMRETLTVKE